MRERVLGALAAVTLVIPAAAIAQAAAPASLAGDYVHSEMELVAGLRLSDDGTFRYGLTVGSLDEQAQGRWTRTGNTITLTSDPRPLAPAITAGPVEAAPGEPFAIRLVGPNGQDVPGVDFAIAFDTGEPLAAYTPGAKWPLPAAERRTPRTITFSKPSYRIQSPPLALDARAGTTATFVLTPNDFGVADLTGARLEIDGDTLVLHRQDGTLRFKRVAR